MPIRTQHVVTALAATAGGLLATAMLSAATASADVWTIGPATAENYAPPEVLSASGIPPFDQTVVEQGVFSVDDFYSAGNTDYFVTGVLTSTQSFGFDNAEFISNATNGFFPNHAVVDVLSLGSFENIYVDLPGDGTGGANLITDTVVTPFGNFDVPVTFDASAFDVSAPAAAAALDADWTTPAADFSALF